jgi:tripartite-type tricarboxylate transporter receptor subunit TctC
MTAAILKSALRRLGTCALAALACASGTAWAAWPDRPIRIIVPFPPGNSSDVSMRLVAEKLGPVLGQSIIVENRTGAGGVIGTEYAAKQPADGYTLAMGSTGPMTIAQWLRPKEIPYDSVRAFVPVGAVSWAPQVMVVRKDYPASNYRELLAYSKRPDVKLSYGSSGNGTTPHLVISEFLHESGIKATHVPYKGGVQSATDVVGGTLDFISDNVPVVQPLLQAGKVKAIGVTSGQRIPSLPDIPTLQEQGLKNFDLQGWILLLAPAGTPDAIVNRLRKEMAALIQDPEVREKLNGLGLVPMDMPTEQLGGFLASESNKWKEIVRISGAAQN